MPAPERGGGARLETLAEASGVRFGTSGVRRHVADLTNGVCRACTKSFLRLLEGATSQVLIGRDLRPSIPGIVRVCAGEAMRHGLTPVNEGILLTPALPLAAQSRGVPAIMITGSHISFDRKGITGWRPRWCGSFPQPPPGQKSAAPQHADLRVERLVCHGDLAHLGLEALDLLVPGVPFSLLQGTFRRQERLVALFRQPVHRYVRFPGHLLQGFAPQQALPESQPPFCRKQRRRPGHGVAIASALGARWRRRGLRQARFHPVFSVHALPPALRSVAQQNV
jgi:hypothetical protein